MSCSGYRLILLWHPDYLLTMAPVSMLLHVSYMLSLCQNEWRTGPQMILSLCAMVWRRNSYNFVRVYVLTSGRALRLTAFARRWHENNGRIG